MTIRTPPLLLHAIVVTALVLALREGPAAQQGSPPSPASIFGFEPGSDDRLAGYDQVVAYLREVDASSERVTLFEAGPTTAGRQFIYAAISSPANLRNLDRLREINRRLAHPRGLTDAEARALAAEGRAFVHIDGGLHSTEVAAPQHIPKLVDTILRRAAEPDMAAILDRVVLLIWPTLNPDGHQMVADWYRDHPPVNGRVPPLPGLYQAYVGHDNNRDAYMLNMVESRTVEFAWRQWEPQIIYVHHQSSPFPTRIWLPPFAEPIAAHAPFLMSRTVNMIGMAIALGLEERGQTGATHMGTGYDAWYPGYIDYLPVFKNIAAFWTETQGSGASPRTTPRESLRPETLRPQSLYASPWQGGTWRLSDAVAYMETASLAVADYAARYKDNLLYNRYQSGRDQIARGRAGGPYAWVFPERQRDPAALAELLRRLAFAGIEVHRYREESTVDGQRVPGGTWVVPADQPFAALARELLEVQTYPEIRPAPGAPLDTPYDAAGWTLPLAMGVDMLTAYWPINYLSLVPSARPPAPTDPVRPYGGAADGTDAAPFDSVPGLGFDAAPTAAAIRPTDGRIDGRGPLLAVNPAENNAFRALNDAIAAGGRVRFRPGTGPDDARYVIEGLPPDRQADLVRALALRAERVALSTDGEGRRPRIGFYDAPANMDAGWTRWVLERYGFELVTITGTDLVAANLGERFDTLLLIDDQRGVLAPGSGPDVQAENDTRVRALDAFVRAGGTLVCLNRSSRFAIDRLSLPVRDVVVGLTGEEFTANGSLVAIEPDSTEQVMAGMPAEAAVFFDRSPVFETLEGFEGAVLARYPATGSPLRSGFLVGDAHLQGRAAALEVRHGRGQVILIGFRPQWRGQTFGSFRVLFNAVLR